MSASTSPLALLGGSPVAPAVLQAPAWPPVSNSAEATLVEIYRSRNWSFNGPHEIRFAKEFANAHDAEFGVFMANGTVTLQCALGAYGVGEGDEVIVPALTWPATAMAVLYVGATPVFVDIEASTLCLDPAAFEAAITPKTKAVIPVHIYGGMANLDEILAIAKKHNLVVIEDCAHAQGGKWNGKGVGSWGDVGSFSFQQTKTMSSGEGGICITNDAEIAERLYRSKHIGYSDGSVQGVVASGPPEGLTCYNFRGTEFQAAILQDQLNTLDELMEKYNRNAAKIEARLADAPGVRVQSRGAKSTRQGYYALPVVFDAAPTKDVPLSRIFEAITAEGLRAGGTYGCVYNHNLWNIAPEKFRIANGGCPVAEIIGSQRTSGISHQYLGADDATIEAIAEVFAKVALNASQL